MPRRRRAGEILLDGVPMHSATPAAAQAAGVSTVYQDLALAAQRDVVANFFMGREIISSGWLPRRIGWLDTRAMSAHAESELARLRTRLPDVHAVAMDLSGGQRQALAIARAAAWTSKVLLLDEPTSALGVEQHDQVLDLIRTVRDDGMAVLFVSHQMPDVLAVCDRAVVLRLGALAATLSADQLNAETLVGYITGARDADTATATTREPGEQAMTTSKDASRVAQATPAEGTAWAARYLKRGHTLAQNLWIGGPLIALIIGFSIWSPYFLTRANWLNTSSTATEVLLLAVGETFVICSGGIDLSVGAILGCSGTAGAWVMAHGFAATAGAAPLTVCVGFGVTLLVGAAFGLLNGLLIAWAFVPPFVVTLGTLGIATGLGYLLNNGQEISNIPSSVTTIGNTNLGGWVPVPVAVTAAIAIWCGLLLAKTRSAPTR